MAGLMLNKKRHMGTDINLFCVNEFLSLKSFF